MSRDCWIVIPVKPPEQCKTRLRPALADGARERLVARMLAHVAGIAAEVAGAGSAFLLGPATIAARLGLGGIDDPGGGLNAALVVALDRALAGGAGRLVILAADLPTLHRDDVRALAEAERDRLIVAADRRHVGTNALSLPLPRAATFRFGFGASSLAAHLGEADRLGLPHGVMTTSSLGFDVDRPEDLALMPLGMRCGSGDPPAPIYRPPRSSIKVTPWPPKR